MNSYYNLIVKTGEAELKALSNSKQEVRETIFPIIELTRGRKSKRYPQGGPFDNKLQELQKLFEGQRVGIDLTSSDELLNPEIRSFYDPSDGYAYYVEFLRRLKQNCRFSEIFPTMIIDYEDPDFVQNFHKEIEELSKDFDTLILRTSLSDESYGLTLIDLCQALPIRKTLIVLIDCGYVVETQIGTVTINVVNRVTNTIRYLLQSHPNLLSQVRFMLAATSFPGSITEVCSEDEGAISLNEITLYKAVLSAISKDTKHEVAIDYADYGSIAERRNDDVIKMARGWVPRIDVPFADRIEYVRRRRPRGQTKYVSTYKQVALRVVEKFHDRVSSIRDNWGISKIVDCANGKNPGASPSFWLSVRMCIHLETQCHRLRSI